MSKTAKNEDSEDKPHQRSEAISGWASIRTGFTPLNLSAPGRAYRGHGKPRRLLATPTVGQEIDALVAEHVFGHPLIRYKTGTVKEKIPSGNVRPLRPYSKDISAAWEVAVKMGVTLIPVEGKMWFALVGTSEGWQSPADLVKYRAAEDFTSGGAAVQASAPLAICLAALTAISKRKTIQQNKETQALSADSPTIDTASEASDKPEPIH